MVGSGPSSRMPPATLTNVLTHQVRPARFSSTARAAGRCSVPEAIRRALPRAGAHERPHLDEQRTVTLTSSARRSLACETDARPGRRGRPRRRAGPRRHLEHQVADCADRFFTARTTRCRMAFPSSTTRCRRYVRALSDQRRFLVTADDERRDVQRLGGEQQLRRPRGPGRCCRAPLHFIEDRLDQSTTTAQASGASTPRGCVRGTSPRADRAERGRRQDARRGI